jgi:hypothetical protein
MTTRRLWREMKGLQFVKTKKIGHFGVDNLLFELFTIIVTQHYL